VEDEIDAATVNIERLAQKRSLIAEHSVCHLAVHAPRGLASPEEFHPKASTERNPWPALVGRNFDPRAGDHLVESAMCELCRSPGFEETSNNT